MPRIPTPADRLRLAIDRRVATARVVHLLGILGRIACAAALAWGTMLLLQRVATTAVDARLVTAVALLTAGATAWPAVRSAIAIWPTRLRIAIAAEQALPELDERISRAVGFLDERPPHGDRGGSPALKALAVEQAAALADRIPQAPLTGAARHLLIAAAGGAALASLAMVTARMGTSFANVPTAGVDQPHTEPIAAETLALGRQIAAVRTSVAAGAVCERRLAEVLTGWFNDAPGMSAVEVPPRRRGLLGQAADLHEDCLTEMIAARKTLLAMAPPLAMPPAGSAKGLHKAAELLAAIDDTTRAESSAAIHDHRLAIAAETAARNADLLERAAALLGAAAATPASESQFTGDALPEPAQPASGQLLARLERIAAEAQAPNAVAMHEKQAFDQAATNSPVPGPTDGGGTTAATTSPRFGTAATPATAVELTSREAELDRLWTLLPEQSLPLRPQAADAASFPSHQQAIEAYYRLLFEFDRPRRQKENPSRP